MNRETVGVVVMAYGTPARPEDIEAYYTHVRRGRPAGPELLDELTRRYQAIGGVSPLAARTKAQASMLHRMLQERVPDRYVVEIGLKHAEPFIEEAVEHLIERGVGRLLGLVLAPHFSTVSVGEYLGRMKTHAVLLDPSLPAGGIESWHVEPAYVDFLSDQVATGLSTMPPSTKVIFTAHALPQRVIDAGDPYPEQLRATGEAVARQVGLDAMNWALACQSAGRTPEPWMGPDLLDVIRDLATDGRTGGVLVCPCGFVSDHLEVLYDLDIEAARIAAQMGLAFARTRVPNDDPLVMAALAERLIVEDASFTPIGS